MLCPMKPTKPTMLSESLARLVEAIEVIAAEAKLGIAVNLQQLSPLEYDLLILWTRQVEQYELQLRLVTATLLQQAIQFGRQS